MGNTSRAALVPPTRCLTTQNAYRIGLSGYRVENNVVSYEFWVEAPQSLGGHAEVVWRTFEEFQTLDGVMARRYAQYSPVLPPTTFFVHMDDEFLSTRAASLEAYLKALLQLEPMPRSQALRRFLNIYQPLPIHACSAQIVDDGFLLAGTWRLPRGVTAAVLSSLNPAWVLRTCSSVSRAFHAAARDSQCWPTLRFRSCYAERWLENLFSILPRTCDALQALDLEIKFESQQLAVALPGGYGFKGLRQLRLRLHDAESILFGTDILSCIDAPYLQRVYIEGGFLTAQLLKALYVVALASVSGSQKGIVELHLSWGYDGTHPIHIGAEASESLQGLLEVLPGVEALSIGLARCLRDLGQPRSLAPQQSLPVLHPFLAHTALLNSLRKVRFDFLSDVVLNALTTIDDHSLRVQSAIFSGTLKHIQQPEEAFITLLSKLGRDLEELSLKLEIEVDLRCFSTNLFRPRVGALPNLWREHTALQSLEVNCMAFDDEGVSCLVDHCVSLSTLRLDRCEYWSDVAVMRIINSLPDLRNLRMRSSALLSDRALYSLLEVAQRLQSIEIEPSYSMSEFALDQLRSRMHPHQLHDDTHTSNSETNVVALAMMEMVADFDGRRALPIVENMLGRGQTRNRTEPLCILEPEVVGTAIQDSSLVVNRACPAIDIGWCSDDCDSW